MIEVKNVSLNVRVLTDRHGRAVTIPPGETRAADLRPRTIEFIRDRSTAFEIVGVETARTPEAPVGSPVTSGEPMVPPFWRDLGWNEMRRLASELSETPIRNKADAEKAIEAAQLRQANGV